MIYSHNLYGEFLATHLRHLAKQNDICLDFAQPIYSDFTQPDFHRVAKELMTSYAKVVVLFTVADDTEFLMREMHSIYRLNEDKRKFLWIACDAAVQTATKFKEIVAGMWGVIPFSGPNKPFVKYYSELLAESNVRNPWFRDFYQEHFDCFIGRNCSNVSVTAHPNYQEQFALVPPLMLSTV